MRKFLHMDVRSSDSHNLQILQYYDYNHYYYDYFTKRSNPSV